MTLFWGGVSRHWKLQEPVNTSHMFKYRNAMSWKYLLHESHYYMLWKYSLFHFCRSGECVYKQGMLILQWESHSLQLKHSTWLWNERLTHKHAVRIHPCITLTVPAHTYITKYLHSPVHYSLLLLEETTGEVWSEPGFVYSGWVRVMWKRGKGQTCHCLRSVTGFMDLFASEGRLQNWVSVCVCVY